MRKTINLFFVMLFVFILAACGNSVDKSSENSEDVERSSVSTSNTEQTIVNTEASESIRIRIAHVANESHPYFYTTEKFVELVAEKSDNRITFDIFPSRQLGDDRELLEQAINGTLESAVISSAVFSGFTPELDVLQIPYLINSYELERKVFEDPISKELLDSLNDSLNLKGLAFFEAGMKHIANNVREVATPEDLKGLKLRVNQSDVLIDSYPSH